MSWTPQSHEVGRDWDITLIGPSLDVPCPAVSRHNFRAFVAKCSVCVREDETKEKIAMKYGTHWTQIWSANENLSNPDRCDCVRCWYAKLSTVMAGY